MLPKGTPENVITKYQDMVFRIAFVYCKKHCDAEDITQEVFLRYLKNRVGFSNDEHLKAWLIRVTINASKSLLRSAWLKRTVPLEDAEHENLISGQQEKPDVYYAVLALPVKYRSVIILYYFEDYSVREIAEILSRTETSVQTQLYRARTMLKKELKEGWQND